MPAILEHGRIDELTNAMRSIIDCVTANNSLTISDFGVFGSMLHDFYHPRFSDVDLTVYGSRKLQTLRETLDGAFRVHDLPLRNEFEDDQPIKGKRWLFKNLSPKEFVWHQRRKLIYALFQDSAGRRVIKAEFEPVRAWQEIKPDPAVKVDSCGWVKMIVRIVDDSGGSFMPSIYGIEPLTILSGSPLASEADFVVSFLEEYRLQAFKDEVVYVEGNLEHIEKKSCTHYQITLTYCPRYYEQTLKTVASQRL